MFCPLVDLANLEEVWSRSCVISWMDLSDNETGHVARGWDKVRWLVSAGAAGSFGSGTALGSVCCRRAQGSAASLSQLAACGAFVSLGIFCQFRLLSLAERKELVSTLKSSHAIFGIKALTERLCSNSEASA